ncbi:MAG: class I SAM-dependent methyltransferase [Candidatus Thorarchaeota archaeon]
MTNSYLPWSDLQGIDEIDVGRYFEYDTDALEMFKKWLDFLQGEVTRVLEVGAGSGFFTSILLRLNPTMELTCLEPDEKFIAALKDRFGNRIRVIQSIIEEPSVDEESFDVAFGHIVIHNLADPIMALKQMKRSVKRGGHVVTIDPVTGSKHYLPNDDVKQAFELLSKAKAVVWDQRHKVMPFPENHDPWNRCYPQLYEEVGLDNIQCHGWTSVFTLSDKRIGFGERKKWISMRRSLMARSKETTKKLLLETGIGEDDIENALATVQEYLKELEQATEKELGHIHEQEIYHRTITIGRRP